MITRTACLLMLATTLTAAVERATFDSAGRVTGLIDQGQTVPVLGHFVLVLEDGREVVLQPHDQRSPITRTGYEQHWQGGPSDALANGVQFDVRWQDAAQGVALTGTVRTAFSRRIRSLDFVLALPRDEFVGGRIEPGAATFPAVKPADPSFLRQSDRSFQFHAAAGRTTVQLSLDRARPARIVDTWTRQGRWYEVRIPLQEGSWRPGEPVTFGCTLALTAHPTVSPVQLTVHPEQVRQPFLGFGANYCWTNTSPIIDYTMEHLQSTWYRFEFKFGPWVAERDQPGELLRRDFELMRRVQQAGKPWIISLWRTPEDFYVPREPGASPMGHGRRIAPQRWDEFLQQLGDYLVYLKQHYGAEPDLFSFNEPDLGVDVIFSPEEHRDAIKRIGAHFERLGLKTKQLLGETANPRDRHLYVLATAADPEAMRYVGGVSFHSWGGATPEQYAAWGDVAEWIQQPLMVGEAGMDPGAYRNRTYDSYSYGLRELKDHFDFVRHARAQISLYWQFTNDYSLVRIGDDGTIHPTGRFHLMRHLNNLSPAPSQVVGAVSDDPAVHVITFRTPTGWVLHLLNTGPARSARLAGIPGGQPWQVTTTTEETAFTTSTWAGGQTPLTLPARSMVTLIRN
jgi:hypothetical protein